jgi:Zn finger protein HypA/HybF involved in hydrogenase expression
MTDDPSQEECPECGGDAVWADNSEELVCTGCGFVLEEVKDDRENVDISSSDAEWTAFESTKESQETDDDQSIIPENSAEWEMWYPCPECRSTDLNLIIESHLSVSGRKDGSYGGETSVEEFNYVECANCNTVLLDETGRS